MLLTLWSPPYFVKYTRVYCNFGRDNEALYRGSELIICWRQSTKIMSLHSSAVWELLLPHGWRLHIPRQIDVSADNSFFHNIPLLSWITQHFNVSEAETSCLLCSKWSLLSIKQPSVVVVLHYCLLRRGPCGLKPTGWTLNNTASKTSTWQLLLTL